MYKLFLLIVFLLIPGTVLFAQNITTALGYESTPGGASITYSSIQVSKPPLYPPFLNSLGQVKRSAVIIEYGDGCFSMADKSSHSFLNAQTTALVTVRGKYDEDHPHGLMRYQKISVDPLPVHTVQNIIGPSTSGGPPKNIIINSDVTDLMEGDTVQVVVTYKKKFAKPGKLLIYYNDGLQAFKTVEPTGVNSRFNVNEVSGDPSQAMLFNWVRTYGAPLTVDGNILTPVNNNQFYQLPAKSNTDAFKYINANLAGSGSSGALLFNLPSGTDNLEHNIFITLLVPGNSIYKARESFSRLTTYIIPDSLQLVPANPTTGVTRDEALTQLDSLTASISFPVALIDPLNPTSGLRAHDPNYIKANVQCTPNCTAGKKQSEKHNYRVHFQNDGAGDAGYVEVIVFIDQKYDIDMGLSDVSGMLANRKHVMNSTFSWHVSHSSTSNMIVFTFKKKSGAQPVKLFGTSNVPNAASNPLTMGDIYFTLSTIPGNIPCYYSRASIVFDGELPVPTKLCAITCCRTPGIFTKIPSEMLWGSNTRKKL